MVAWTIAMPRRESDGAFGSIAFRQPLDLASTDTESLCSTPRHQQAVSDRLDDLETIELAHAHGNQASSIHDRLPAR
jgi:hypothetical protein